MPAPLFCGWFTMPAPLLCGWLQDAVEEGGHGSSGGGSRGGAGDKANMAGKEMDRDGLDLQGRAAVSGRGGKTRGSRGRGRGQGRQAYMQYVSVCYVWCLRLRALLLLLL